MSKVASLTIAAKSPSHRLQASQSRDEKSPPAEAHSSSESEEEPVRTRRRSSGSGQTSPERRRSTGKRQQQKVYDDERGLIHIARSGRMSSRQKSLEKELETEDPALLSTHDEAKAASSDDGLEDSFIPRSEKRDSNTYYMVKDSRSSDEGGSIYEKRNVEAPRKKSEGAGRRIRSATGQLMDNYEKDQSFDELSGDERNGRVNTSFTPVSVLKQTYTAQASNAKTAERSKVDLELDQIRRTLRGQGMMQDNDTDDDTNRNPVQEPEVLYRKPLSSIKNRFLAAASGHKMAPSDSDDEVVDETKQEEILPSPTSVNDLKQQWQTKGGHHDNSKIQALDEINSAEVVLARNAFKQMESKKETNSSINRPIVHRVKDAKAVMEMRRHKTYGDDDETVDGIVKHEGQAELTSTEIDREQIKAARRGYEQLEEVKHVKKTFIKKPSMKLIKQEQVSATMNEHRRKVSGEDWAIEQARKYSNGFDEETPLDSIANGNGHE